MMESTPAIGRRPGVTIYQVANRAGVSIATVSRVLRGTARVSPDTQQRVLDAISELRYTPSRLGRALAERRHAANGIVFPELFGPYYSEVVLGYENAASDLGRSVLILSTHGRAAVRDIVLDLASRVDGLVLFDGTVDDDLTRELVESGLPIVLLGRPGIAGVDAVSTENVQSARVLVDHLVGHGRRRFAFVGDPQVASDPAERWSAVSEALAGHRLAPPALVRCEFDEEAARVMARDLLTRDDRPDALVCANDQIALGVLLAAEELGVRVPAEVAVTGWDDVMAAKYVRPGLTTVRQPMIELGARAARALDERITGTRSIPIHDVLPTELVVRDSCGEH
jgi:LacI family transcriptional regulator